MTEIEKLIHKRRQIKGQLTRFENFINAVEVDNYDELKIRFHKIEDIINIFEEIQVEIECLSSDLDKEALERETFENKYFSLITKTKRLLKQSDNESNADSNKSRSSGAASINGNNSHISLASNNNTVKLPKISLPEFSGNYEDFRSFKETFNSLIDNRNYLDEIQKFLYLKSCLKKEALQVIEALETSANSYKISWELLNKRFENKRLVISKHLKAILEIEKVHKESSTKYRSMLDTLLKHLRSLEALGLPTHQWDAIIVFIISQKLAASTLKAWESKCDQDEIASLNKFVEFLQKQSQVLEALENDSKDKYFKPELQRFHARSGLQSSNLSMSKTFESAKNKIQFRCSLCHGSHNLYSCRKFLTMNHKDRQDHVKKHKICYNCLKSGHTADKCISGACRACNAKHNTLLHQEENSPQQDEQHSSLHSSENNAQPIDQSILTVTQTTIILSTAVILVTDVHGRKQPCRVLLDSGSQTNFITENMAQLLGIPCSKVSSTISGISGIITKGCKGLKCKISSRDGNYSCTLDFVIMPRITLPLPSINIEISKWNIPSHIELADPMFHKRAQIDMLIGAGEFFNLMEGNKIRIGPNLPILQQTKIGWIVAGQVANTKENITRNEQGCYLNLDQSIRRFWEIEVPNVRVLNPEEEACEILFQEITARDHSGRFEVRLPMKRNPNELEEALKIQQEVIAVLSQGRFELHKWCANNSALLERIPPDKTEAKYILSLDNQPSIKTLGLWWKPNLDIFKYTFNFILLHARNFGGLWESSIKSMKYHLRRVVGDALLTFEEMSTYLAMIEACLNSRPLIPLSSDPNDLSTLTPGQFLIGDSLTAVVEPDLTTCKASALSRWRRIQKLTQHFWQRWAKEYISSLQERRKWNQRQLVLIKDENLPPLKWSLGRVIETHPRRDGFTRVVSLKTVKGVVKRAISKVCTFPQMQICV